MTEPCDKCPFRNDVKPFITKSRVKEIYDAEEFPCHKTVQFDDEGEALYDNEGRQACAGWLIMRERDENPSQIMRIGERLQLYDRTKLNMNSPIYNDLYEMVDAHNV